MPAPLPGRSARESTSTGRWGPTSAESRSARFCLAALRTTTELKRAATLAKTKDRQARHGAMLPADPEPCFRNGGGRFLMMAGAHARPRGTGKLEESQDIATCAAAPRSTRGTRGKGGGASAANAVTRRSAPLRDERVATGRAPSPLPSHPQPHSPKLSNLSTHLTSANTSLAPRQSALPLPRNHSMFANSHFFSQSKASLWPPLSG